MSTEKTLGRRIAEFRKSIGLSQQQLADILDVSQGYVGDIEAGRSGPSTRFFTLMIGRTNVSADWLYTGEGAMRRQVTQTSTEPLDQERTAMLALYEALEPDQRREILQVAQEKKRLNEVERLLAKVLQKMA